jgi:alpha-1,2-rhamnosyltransferase
MSDSEVEKAKISAYMLGALSEELDKVTRHPVDPYTKFVYDRARELYWTISRAFKTLIRQLSRSRGLPALPRGVALTGDVPAPAGCNRLFIDMTNTVASGAKTGVQRVVREIAQNCALLGAGIPVVIEAGQLVPYCRHPTLPTQIEPGPGDVLLILDAAWNNVSDYPAVMSVIKARGGRTIVAVYDTLPLTYPALFNPSIVCGFRAWREQIVLASDAAVAISRATAESLAANLRGGGPPANLPIGWWPLGADFAKVSKGEPSEKVARTASGASYFLSVGTLEPRKGYPIAIDAFERLWGAGVDTRYVIVGRPGWNTSALQERLLKHKEFNRRLFWFENATDADLHVLYSQARGAVLCSVAEGFGLPLIEAAFHGVPVIASDIPVFREVGGEGARYFDLLDSASLAAAIEQTLARPRTAPSVRTISWRESAELLVRLIREDRYQLRPERPKTPSLSP